MIWGPLTEYSAVEAEDAIAALTDHIQIVGDLQNCPTLFFLKLVQQLVKVRLAAGVEASGCFVKDQQSPGTG